MPFGPGSPPVRPAPPASSPAVRRKMQHQAQKETGPELALRRALHGRGLRYRLHRRPVENLRRRADIVFRSARVAVFVDGCFWHGCPAHGRQPHANSLWWEAKLERNKARDQDTNRRLSDAGWTVVRVWEHDDPESSADLISSVVTSKRVSQTDDEHRT